MSYRELYSSDEWRILQMSIFWIFNKVAFADQKVDTLEIEAIRKLSIQSEKFQSKFAAELIGSLPLSQDELMNSYNIQSKVQLGLHKISSLLDKLENPKEILLFKKSLIAIGFYTAMASNNDGDRLVSYSESAALKEIAENLHLDPLELALSPTLNDILQGFQKDGD